MSEAPHLTPDERKCAVEWCRSLAYPGSDLCQFHEVVNPYDDIHEPDDDHDCGEDTCVCE